MIRAIAKSICILLLAVVVVNPLTMGQTGSSTTSDLQKAASVLDVLAEYMRFLETLSSLRDFLEQALYFTSEGVEAVRPEDRARAAQAALNLLEGERSPLFDASLGSLSTFKTGMRPMLEEYRLDAGGVGMTSGESREWYVSDIPTESFLDTIIRDLLDYLRLASQSAVRATRLSVDLSDGRDGLLTTQALVFTAHSMCVELTRSLRLTVSPGASLQSAIDRAWAGSTITIEPGVYRETLDINKSVTLVGMGFDVVISPVNGQDGILIHADEEIAVEIRGVTIRQAGTGLSVEGEAIVTLDSVHIDACGTGLRISDHAILTGEEAHWSDCGLAIHAEGESSLDLIDSGINDCTSNAAAVVIEDAATVSMQQVWVNRSLGGGFLVTGSGSLNLNDCNIYYSAGDGILLTGEATLEIQDCDINLNQGFGIRALTNQCDEDADRLLEPFVGEVTGAGNLILAEGQHPGNKLGAVCPEELEYLTDPKPAGAE